MDPIQRFGGGGETTLHPVIAIAMFIAAMLILTLPRRKVIVPLLWASFLIPMREVIVVGAFHFPMIRILILLGWLRIIPACMGHKVSLLVNGPSRLDKAVVLTTIIGAINFVLLWRESSALINQLGTVFTSLGLYFLLRSLVRDEAAIAQAIKTLAYISATIAVIMLLEQGTGKSLYGFLGQWLQVREGRIRSQASFGHAILAGVFGAITFPLFVGLWLKGENRLRAVIGTAASVVIVAASASSTPIMALSTGIFGFCLWPSRKLMHVVRRGLVLMLVVLHLVMKAPVWALIGRLDLVGGSSADHRYQVVDRFIRHFGDWWVIGSRDFMNWGWGMWDVANQYVGIGETTGLGPLIFFIAVIVYGFKYAGSVRHSSNKRTQMFGWALGVAVFANAVAFFGISYFDQTLVVVWNLLLAFIGAAHSSSSAPGTKAVVACNTNTDESSYSINPQWAIPM